MPSLVLVSGLPASGKSTLSRRLAADLRFPLVSRDQMRTAAFVEVTQALPADEQWRLGRSLDLLINHITERIFDAGVGAVVDSNFNWHQQRDALRQLVSDRSPRCFEVCLWADPLILRRRFVERNDPPLSDDLEPIFSRAVARQREPVLDSQHPIVEFDTTDFAALESGYAALVESIRTHFAMDAPSG